jgi:hypothetical protein
MELVLQSVPPRASSLTYWKGSDSPLVPIAVPAVANCSSTVAGCIEADVSGEVCLSETFPRQSGSSAIKLIYPKLQTENVLTPKREDKEAKRYGKRIIVTLRISNCIVVKARKEETETHVCYD